MKGNVIQLNTLHLNSVRLNGIGKVQSVSLKGGSTEDPVFPPVEPPVEPEPIPTYTLSASVTNGKVSAKRNGSAVTLPFTANEGDTIVLSVTPNDGYAFEGWNDGNTDNPRSITMTADVVLSAQCVEVVAPPVGKYIQFEDPAVEAICVANWSSDGIGLTEEDAAAVTTIGTTFKGNTEITSFDELRYFTGVTSLSANAFDGCTALTSIAFDNIVTMNVNAIYNCNSLTQIILPNIIRIESYQQRYNSVLAKIDIGENCTYIANRAFSDCANVAAIICRATTPPALGYATALATNNCLIYVPDASLEAYKTATNWNQFADRIHPLSEIEGSLVFYDKLVGDGTAYINTEYYPTSWDNVEWDADKPNSYNRQMFGEKSSALSIANLVHSATQTYYCYKLATSTNLINEDNTGRQRRMLRIVDLGGGTYRREVADLILGTSNTIEASWTGKAATATQTLRVFGSIKADGAMEKIYNGAIRSLIITDARTNEVKLNLKPCTFAGEAGMWDEVGNKFYGNSSTNGEFSVANDE